MKYKTLKSLVLSLALVGISQSPAMAAFIQLPDGGYVGERTTYLPVSQVYIDVTDEARMICSSQNFVATGKNYHISISFLPSIFNVQTLGAQRYFVVTCEPVQK